MCLPQPWHESKTQFGLPEPGRVCDLRIYVPSSLTVNLKADLMSSDFRSIEREMWQHLFCGLLKQPTAEGVHVCDTSARGLLQMLCTRLVAPCALPAIGVPSDATACGQTVLHLVIASLPVLP